MTQHIPLSFHEIDIDAFATAQGRIAIVVPAEGTLDRAARRVNRLTKGAVVRALESDAFERLGTGAVMTLAWPAGLAAEAVDILKLPRRPTVQEARKGGAALAKVIGKDGATLAIGSQNKAEEVLLGLMLRGYSFDDHKTSEAPERGAVRVLASKPDELSAKTQDGIALAEGVFFTRDLVNEPANVLTTTEFAARLKELGSLGVEVEVLEEDALTKLKMDALLCVGQGSDSPSKVVIMRWNGGEKDKAPLALVGKGVVFDTGGISLKPAAGMEDMTMDMGGAGVVAGVMHALARRKAKANVVGLVGLVENMPSGNAVRPGDVVTSMKGDTIEVVNTDAEGRLVLCDVMWHAQETLKPAAMIDLATLTGACIIALGHENAAVYSNDDDLCNAFLKSAKAEGEGAWHMPMGQAYDDLLKSPVADMKNIGGRAAGSVTAAQFLGRFVQKDVPWIHLDIAGVAHVARDLDLSPKGATGWGVLALNRLVADTFEES